MISSEASHKVKGTNDSIGQGPATVGPLVTDNKGVCQILQVSSPTNDEAETYFCKSGCSAILVPTGTLLLRRNKVKLNRNVIDCVVLA